jgi:hypothetical protein
MGVDVSSDFEEERGEERGAVSSSVDVKRDQREEDDCEVAEIESGEEMRSLEDTGGEESF